MKTIFAMIAVFATLLLSACDSDLEVQQEYAFQLETMPVPKKLAQGETIEIRCELVKEGDYKPAEYTIRYFQPDGDGELRLDDGTVLLPNDRYPLERTEFRLYYTSPCDEQQTLDVYIEDSFGQVVKVGFSFQDVGVSE
ncbi:MAG: DUF3872 domain-containing protein [Bacteroidales bacterium]